MKHINQTIVDALRNDKKLRIIHLQEAMNLLLQEVAAAVAAAEEEVEDSLIKIF